MFDLIATVLAFFYDITSNYALAIALLTLSVMVLVTPLTLKGTKSMIQMQRLQPEMKRIQQEFKGDRQRMNEEMMRFYQEHKINPLGGCLPMLIQAPIFIILYRVISKLTKVGSDGFFEPSYISKDSQLYQDLSTAKRMMSFGIDLSHSAVQEIQDSFTRGIPFLVLVFLVGLTSWYQQRQIMSRTKNSAVNPTQQALMKVVPFIWPVVLLNLPSALAVYGLVSNLYRIAQQGYITRTLYRTDPVPAVVDVKEVKESKPKPKTDGPVLPPKAKKRLEQAPPATQAKRPAPSSDATSRPRPTGRVTPKAKPGSDKPGGSGTKK